MSEIDSEYTQNGHTTTSGKLLTYIHPHLSLCSAEEEQLDVAKAEYIALDDLLCKYANDFFEKHKSIIQKAWRYFEAELEVTDLLLVHRLPSFFVDLLKQKIVEDSHRSTIRFGRATETLRVAKIRMSLTEENLSRMKSSARIHCLEVLKLYISQVNEAQNEEMAAAKEHDENSVRMMEIYGRVKKTYERDRSPIEKAKTFYEDYEMLTKKLEKKQQLIRKLMHGSSDVRDLKFCRRNLISKHRNPAIRTPNIIYKQRNLEGGLIINLKFLKGNHQTSTHHLQRTKTTNVTHSRARRGSFN
ncbi:unnamed protein product [Auanema sp. JU1783]|nr:unnamed protein product [Auanema sp. JU1783]